MLDISAQPPTHISANCMQHASLVSAGFARRKAVDAPSTLPPSALRPPLAPPGEPFHAVADLDQRNALPSGFLVSSVRHPPAAACHGPPEVIFLPVRPHRRSSALSSCLGRLVPPWSGWSGRPDVKIKALLHVERLPGGAVCFRQESFRSWCRRTPRARLLRTRFCFFVCATRAGGNRSIADSG